VSLQPPQHIYSPFCLQAFKQDSNSSSHSSQLLRQLNTLTQTIIYTNDKMLATVLFALTLAFATVFAAPSNVLTARDYVNLICCMRGCEVCIETLKCLQPGEGQPSFCGCKFTLKRHHRTAHHYRWGSIG
jgi:hypothetical protein